MQMATLRVGIIGASGYTGAELLRLVAGHPAMEVVVATGDSMAGRRAADVYPSLAVAYPDLVFEPFDETVATGLDVAFLGLPHEASMQLAPRLVGSVGCVVDLSAAYRLKDRSAYPTFYGFEHTQPDLLAEAVFGLPELHRSELQEARIIATPGCHVTAATLALRPLVAAGLVEVTGIVVNTVTGITGAGRTPTETNVFANIDSNAVAYGLIDHRHTPEMEQEIGAQAALHSASRPDEPWPAGDVLRQADRALLGRSCRERTPRLLCRRAVRRRDRRAAGHEVGARVERGARRRPVRRAHGHGDRHVRHRQPHQGRLGRRRAGRERGARPRRDRRPRHDRARAVTVTSDGSTTPASAKAATLVEALPYIRRFAGKTVVVKYGGNALAGTSDHDALASFAEDIVLMRLVGMRPVVVHGGGPQISDLMARLGKETTFVDGLRVTDAETVDIARMVLKGQVNPQLVAAINVHGRYAVGLSGIDAGLIRAVARDPELGFVGDVTQINPEVIHGLIDDEFIPVIATIGSDAVGQSYNINADTAAGAIAEALGAEKLVYLTDIEGLRREVDDPASLIRQTTADELDALVADGTIAGGMIPKVRSCTQAVRNGVRRAHILDGRVEHVLLLEVFTDAGIGTMVVGAPDETGATT